MQLGRPGIYIFAIALFFWAAPFVPIAHERHPLTFLPALALMSALPVAVLLQSLPRASLAGATFGVMAVLLVASASPILTYGHQYDILKGHNSVPPSWAFKAESRQPAVAIASRYGWYNDWQGINRRLAPGKKVALPGQIPNYYVADGDLDRVFYLDSVEALPLAHMTSPEEIQRFLEEKGVQLIYAPQAP